MHQAKHKEIIKKGQWTCICCFLDFYEVDEDYEVDDEDGDFFELVFDSEEEGLRYFLQYKEHEEEILLRLKKYENLSND